MRPGLDSRHRGDAGLTLVELLISIVIMGIITVPLGTALVMFFQNRDSTTDRLSVSHDVQIAASYFAQDVDATGVRNFASPAPGVQALFPLTQSIELTAPPTTGVAPCGPAGTPNAVIRLLWTDASAATPVLVRVAYVVKTVGTEKQLHRLKCVGNGTVVTDLTLAHNVVTVDAPVCKNPAVIACDGAAVPQTVTLTLHLRALNSTDPILDVTLTGQRRQT